MHETFYVLYNAGYDRDIYTSVCSPAALRFESRWCDVFCQTGFQIQSLNLLTRLNTLSQRYENFCARRRMKTFSCNGGGA